MFNTNLAAWYCKEVFPVPSVGEMSSISVICRMIQLFCVGSFVRQFSDANTDCSHIGWWVALLPLCREAITTQWKLEIAEFRFSSSTLYSIHYDLYMSFLM